MSQCRVRKERQILSERRKKKKENGKGKKRKKQEKRRQKIKIKIKIKDRRKLEPIIANKNERNQESK